MNTSMLAGERRWASARRGGMTVLGKVAVPKPINLPSQRLENHGMDPNVEIVPKGTVSWGSRSSSSCSNPWTSSSLSPKADGGTVSPSHLSGRPSSGGSGTRPSTSGSDKTHDPIANAWVLNSRPSSASGTLSSNQTSSASLRPRSAENRPNSSQLSRFADPVSKSSAAWGSSVTAERLGVKSSKDDGFSLSSGDFPTLGSEKDNSVKNIESEDHSRPSSASGKISQAKEEIRPQDDVKHGTVNTWRADGSHSAEDDIHPSMEKWQGDPHQYFNGNTPPQRYDAWRGPPMNGPAGVWYGGRPRGPAFGAHVPPGGFPMEPFPYYRPQIPPPPLAGSQPIPQPGPRGPHPKNGDLFRPQMPDAYPRPGMSFRPGFYPGHHGPMPFEGYYGPPMGYCNSERDMPYMGMAAGPPVYNGYAPPNPDMNNPHGRAAGRGPAGKTMSEQVEPDHWEDAHGPKRVPLKSHFECDQREEVGNREPKVQPNVSHPGKSRLPVSSRKNEWGAEEDTDEALFAKRTAPSENPSHIYENRVQSADGVKVKSFECMSNVKGTNDNWTDKSESVPSFPQAVLPQPVVSDKDSSFPAANKNSALMNKIDGLNAKFRGSDGRNESPSAYNKEGERNVSKIVAMKVSNDTGEVNTTAGSFGRTPVLRNFASAPSEVPVGDKLTQPIAVVSRRSHLGGHSRADHRVKGKLNSQDGDGWRRKTLNTESSSAVAASNNEFAPNTHADGPDIIDGEASESSIIDPAVKVEGDSVETYDLTDIQAQRVKMRELAKQRALQLQKEEEDRIKEQKAKALAKLEELNRRTLAGESANQKAERTQVIGGIPAEQEESRTVSGPVIAELNIHESGFNLVMNPAVAAVDRDSNTNETGESVEVSRNLHLEIKRTAMLESDVPPLPTDEDSHDSSTKKVASQVNDGGFSRQKRAGSKQKQNTLVQKSLNENSLSSVASETPKDTHVATTDITLKESSSSDVPNNSNVVVEPSVQQRRKTNRTHKTRPKLDETPASHALPSVTSDTNQGNESIGNGGSNNSMPNLGVSTVTEPDSGVQPQEVCSSLPNEECQSRVPNQWKPHHPRKLPRGQQAHRFSDKLHSSDTVVWAPVRSHNKVKNPDEASLNTIQESSDSSKGNDAGHNSLKGKRAEMERYVPKPVAKELAQQGSTPSLVSSVSLSRSNEGSGWEQPGSASFTSPQPMSSETAGSEVEIYGGDGSHNKYRKDHGAWRQRGSTDSSRVKGVNSGPSPTSEPTNDIQQSKELVQHMKSKVNTANAETKISGVVNASDGNGIHTITTTAAASKYHSVKDQGATTRGRRHSQRGPRITGNNPDPENTYSGEIDGSSVQSTALDLNQTDRNIVLKETRSFGGERASSHWQPKSGPNHVTAEFNRVPKKDHPQRKVQVVPQQDKESSNASQSHQIQSVSVNSNMTGDSVADHRQEFDREKKPALVKGLPYSPSQDPVGPGESTANTGDQLEHNAPPGSRRNGRQNNRPIRGHESRGDWSSGHDNRPHNIPPYRERQRHNVHYEYQPVGPVKGNKSEKAEEPADGGADSMDQKYRERGQSHSRRGGHVFRRQTGAAHVASNLD